MVQRPCNDNGEYYVSKVNLDPHVILFYYLLFGEIGNAPFYFINLKPPLSKNRDRKGLTVFREDVRIS